MVGNQPTLNIPYLQSVPLLWRYQPARQWGVEIHPQDCQPRLCRPLHLRDVTQVDCLWPLAILWKRLDLPWLRHCHCKLFHQMTIIILDHWAPFHLQVSVVSLAVEGNSNLTAFRSLRTLRALRPLRAISRWQGMKVLTAAAADGGGGGDLELVIWRSPCFAVFNAATLVFITGIILADPGGFLSLVVATCIDAGLWCWGWRFT